MMISYTLGHTKNSHLTTALSAYLSMLHLIYVVLPSLLHHGYQ